MMNNKFYESVMSRAMPKSDMSAMTDFYKKNLEYMAAVNKVMQDVTKTVYEVHVDFVKELAANSKDILEKAAHGKHDVNSGVNFGKDVMNKCGSCGKTIGSVVASCNKKVIDLTKRHADYAKSKVASSPITKAMSEFDPLEIIKKVKAAAGGMAKKTTAKKASAKKSTAKKTTVKKSATAAKKPTIKTAPKTI